jgi:hypothetical protein
MTEGKLITVTQLWEILDYDPDTGEFRWRTSRGTKMHRAGDAAGFLQNGYRVVWIGKRPYGLHRLAWLWMTAAWPRQIDHVNLNRADNRWCNLREATTSQNLANARMPSTNTSGFKGVSRAPHGVGWWHTSRLTANQSVWEPSTPQSARSSPMCSPLGNITVILRGSMLTTSEETLHLPRDHQPGLPAVPGQRRTNRVRTSARDGWSNPPTWIIFTIFKAISVLIRGVVR